MKREKIEQQAEEYRQPYRDGGYRLSSKDVRDAFEEGAEWMQETMIEKACQWILNNMHKYIKVKGFEVFVNNEDMANDFKRAMEE